jgi:hypothetical protein
MDRLLDFIEKHKFGIIVTFMVHLCLLLYTLIGTYKTQLPGYDRDFWSEVVEEEDFVELKPEQIIPPDPNMAFSGDIRNSARDANDTREKSTDNYSKNRDPSRVEQSVKDYERQLFEEFAASRTGGDGTQKSSTTGEPTKAAQKSDNNKTSSSSTDSKNDSKSGGSNNQFGGNVMVDFKVGDNRKPHNNNTWHVRNPGYKCGNDANGMVYVSIRVNQNGDVISAKYEAGKSNGANACMIDQALSYAKKSRFAFNSGNANQEDGYIIYRFISKR